MSAPTSAHNNLSVGKCVAPTAYEFDPLSDSRWESFVLNHPRASVFHSTNWLKALKNAYGYDSTVMTTCPRQSALTNGLVFSRVESWLTGRRLVSLPFADHCEPLVNGFEELNDLLFRMRSHVDDGTWRYTEIRPIAFQAAKSTGFGKSNAYYLHRLHLNGKSIEELFHHFHKSCVQRKIRRAEREGLKYEEGTSETLFQQFYDLLIVTRRRMFLPPQPQSWFRALIAAFGRDVKIRIVSKDAVPVACIFKICHKKTMVYKYGCSDARFNKLGGMVLLLWNTIQEAKDKGLDELDMGRSDSSNLGLISFKEHWGANRTHLNYWRYPNQPASAAEGWQDNLRRRVVPHVPSRILEMVGSVLYRHMG
jgi:lipid II:glycine glycyltransferase (peptidoglycan interpeptide bridge formation enzyme)